MTSLVNSSKHPRRTRPTSLPALRQQPRGGGGELAKGGVSRGHRSETRNRTVTRSTRHADRTVPPSQAEAETGWH